MQRVPTGLIQRAFAQRFLYAKLYIMKHIPSRGVATLPAVMVLGIMSLAVAVGITAVALSESFISQGSIQSNKALFYAETGARDALLRIARNKDFAATSYTLDFTTTGTGCTAGWAGCATVSVSATTPKVATSTGAMGSSMRTLVLTIPQDVDGAIISASTVWSEATI